MYILCDTWRLLNTIYCAMHGTRSSMPGPFCGRVVRHPHSTMCCDHPMRVFEVLTSESHSGCRLLSYGCTTLNPQQFHHQASYLRMLTSYNYVYCKPTFIRAFISQFISEDVLAASNVCDGENLRKMRETLTQEIFAKTRFSRLCIRIKVGLQYITLFYDGHVIAPDNILSHDDGPWQDSYRTIGVL